MVNEINRDNIEKLQEFLRHPLSQISANDPVPLHKDMVANIWEYALNLTNHDIGKALETCVEALKSAPQSGDTLITQYWDRLDGIPSKAFGDVDGFIGVDKLQHFFKTASIAYSPEVDRTINYDNPDVRSIPLTGGPIAQIAGRAYEIYDWFRSIFGTNSGGYDHGDIHADDLGAEFGTALARDPASCVSIRDFLTGPSEEHLSTAISQAKDNEESLTISPDEIAQQAIECEVSESSWPDLSILLEASSISGKGEEFNQNHAHLITDIEVSDSSDTPHITTKDLMDGFSDIPNHTTDGVCEVLPTLGTDLSEAAVGSISTQECIIPSLSDHNYMDQDNNGTNLNTTPESANVCSTYNTTNPGIDFSPDSGPAFGQDPG